MNATEFYERYWQRPAEIGSELGLAVAPRQALLRRALRSLPPGAPVLDAGCGAGDFSAFIAGLGYNVIGVDVATAAVSHARRQHPQIQFHAAAIEAGLPFQDASFAAIWCSEVLEHLFDIHRALAELNRVLRPGGLLVLTTPYHGLAKNLIITLKGFDSHFNPYLSHIRFFTRRTLTGCIERAGFAVEAWGGIGRAWPVWKSQTMICRKVRAPGPAPEIIG
jgi:2-polyprenyl-6-hydroxyphenyl methylase/3-demethylubiquinone-9 3-methyltransferase